jgi:hypothetical protein
VPVNEHSEFDFNAAMRLSALLDTVRLNSSSQASHRLFHFKEKIIMRTLKSLAVLLAFGCYVPFALAAEASVAISSPADGEKLSRTAKTLINYEVTPGPEGDHTLGEARQLFSDAGKYIAVRMA